MSFVFHLSDIPRVRLAHLPTPLEPMPRLTRALGGPPLWVKRDDVLGPVLGGNKTRKLEFLFGEALAHRATAVATFGGLQSNFARQMAGGARALGLEPHCYYFTPRPERLEGNLLLAHVLGAKLHFIPFGGVEARPASPDNPAALAESATQRGPGTGKERARASDGGDRQETVARPAGGGRTLEQAIRLVRWVVRLTPSLWRHRTYYMPVGGHAVTGALGYVLAALELHEQLRQHGISRAVVVTAAGTGGTLAGLMAGFQLWGLEHRLAGIDVGKLWRGFPESIAALASAVCARLGQPHAFRVADVPLIEARYVGEGYARPTPEALNALWLAARTEGLLLDPVYTSKAMAGLIDLLVHMTWPDNAPIVFWHTGGLPALWAYPGVLGQVAPQPRPDEERHGG